MNEPKPLCKVQYILLQHYRGTGWQIQSVMSLIGPWLTEYVVGKSKVLVKEPVPVRPVLVKLRVSIGTVELELLPSIT